MKKKTLSVFFTSIRDRYRENHFSLTRKTDQPIAKIITIKGLVQGVGFRPFVYRLALKHGIAGYVYNTNAGVIVRAEGDCESIHKFIAELDLKHPPAAELASLSSREAACENLETFRIAESRNAAGLISEISPDIAVCEKCLEDMRTQVHRISYPFINCTNCGPRFSIVKDFPYDRAKTTMEAFPMCEHCEAEYKDILDRRFHAQPVACNTCGPVYTLHKAGLKTSSIEEITDGLSNILKQEGIVAVKGLGGFHLMCDAYSERAVNRLRSIKQRDGKPFAVMFSGMDTIRKLARVTEAEEEALKSWRRPIILLDARPHKLAPGICVGFPTLGAFLPYMPFHYLLFEKASTDALVLTSGNISDEPILTENEEALQTFSPLTDAVLCYNRDIYNRTDDSVGRIINRRERIFRRSRGHAPNPLYLKDRTEGIFAAGAELVNCFCIGKETQAIMSQHIGDLKNAETHAFYEQTFETFSRIYRFEPRLVVTDLHPDYLSTRFGNALGKETLRVQHHHAHIVSCMTENGWDETVIGLSFDGTGLGDDGKIWGSEFLLSDPGSYERRSHFEYIPLPGGDKAVKEPWRIAVAYLHKIFGRDFYALDLDFLKHIPEASVKLVVQAIEKKINCPESCSAGRLFDAVSALLNLCTHAGFHAEAPMRLEALTSSSFSGSYDFEAGNCISFRPMIGQIIDDLHEGMPAAQIATKFHRTILWSAMAVINEISRETGIKRVALSGGTFQNRYLTEALETQLLREGYQPGSQHRIPCNDGGIALGQLAVAARKTGGQI